MCEASVPRAGQVSGRACESYIEKLVQSATSKAKEWAPRTLRVRRVRQSTLKCTGLKPPEAFSVEGGTILAVLA